ncbi:MULTISPECIES: alpha/beta hydrolase [Maribacter]|uniref:Alpha/beta hydrolase-fold protein n=1 Tax=Maribacter flavus TaxID=1658664 RepID=A0A5B2TZF5_9FLAO|nr:MULTISPECIES: alpha/beta hydrolase-fold protein [Maribacter]KAA2219682.1 prolyl oligopeptidase family serine peptidase [Maribacter flavus]MDC6407124.1 alpha/beta hydrolase-fold protein [Maribacter sp. PR66]MEE1971785.1 alpha/beta hydrolase-fold protein [Maribacter flavus]
MQGSFRTIELSDAPYEFDGLRFLTVKTPNLKGRGDICLYVPKTEQPLTDLPIYILLHGVYGSAWVWALKGGAHKTASELMQRKQIKPAIVAMPSDGLWGDGSAYFPHHQKDFARWIVEDVPLAIKENIPEASSKSKLCIGGLSMGGYGALWLGSQYPEKFCAISAHSAITRLEEMALFVEEPLTDYTQAAKTPDVIDLIKAHQTKMSLLRFDCGVGDELIAGNRLLTQQLQDLNFPHIYEEFPGGHQWEYWQTHVRKTYQFFNISIAQD